MAKGAEEIARWRKRRELSTGHLPRGASRSNTKRIICRSQGPIGNFGGHDRRANKSGKNWRRENTATGGVCIAYQATAAGSHGPDCHISCLLFIIGIPRG